MDSLLIYLGETPLLGYKMISKACHLLSMRSTLYLFLFMVLNTFAFHICPFMNTSAVLSVSSSRIGFPSILLIGLLGTFWIDSTITKVSCKISLNFLRYFFCNIWDNIEVALKRSLINSWVRFIHESLLVLKDRPTLNQKHSSIPLCLF